MKDKLTVKRTVDLEGKTIAELEAQLVDVKTKHKDRIRGLEEQRDRYKDRDKA